MDLPLQTKVSIPSFYLFKKTIPRQNSDQQERWLKYLLLEVERVKSAGAGDESQAADGSRARSVSLLSMDSRTGEGQPKDGRSADQNSEFVEEPVFAAGTNDDDDTRSMMFEDPHNLEEDSSKPGTSGTDDTVSVGPKSGHDDDKAKGSKLELFSTRNKSLKKRGHTLGEIAEKVCLEQCQWAQKRLFTALFLRIVYFVV